MADNSHPPAAGAAPTPAHPAPAPNKSWTYRGWNLAKRHPKKATAAVLLLLLGVVFITSFMGGSAPVQQTATAPATLPAESAAAKPDTELSVAIGREVGRAIQGQVAPVQAELEAQRRLAEERDAAITKLQNELARLRQQGQAAQAAPPPTQPPPAPQAAPVPPAAGQQAPGATTQRQARVSTDRALKVYIQTILDDALGDD